jgi:hypothetical protein
MGLPRWSLPREGHPSDIYEDRGEIESYSRFTCWIADGHEREYWMAFNKSANFLSMKPMIQMRSMNSILEKLNS